MQRPSVVWVFTILVAIGVLFELFGVFLFFGGLGTMTFVPILMTLIGLLIIIPRVMMVVKFFMLKKDAQKWVHISYGLFLALTVVDYIIYFATANPLGVGLVAPPGMFMVIIYLVFWWALIDYIKKKQIDGQNIFT